MRLVLAGAAAAALAVGAAVPAAHAAIAAPTAVASSTTSTPPPWEPDPNSVGGLEFFNSSGQQIFGGNLTDQPIAAYVEGTSTVRAGDTKATLYGFLPQNGLAPGAWSGEALGASTSYPNSGAPAPLDTSALPLETGSSGDESIATLEADFPNTDTTTDGYANLYQLRLRTSAVGLGLTVQYDSADILVDTTAGTWSVFYTKAPATTTSLAVSPSSKAYYGSKVTMTATVTPSAAPGTVEFKDGTKLLKTVAVSTGKAVYATKSLADGTHKLSAVFVPTNTAQFAGSTSKTVSITVSPRPTTTTLSASKTSLVAGQTLTLTAKETPITTGSVLFYDGTTKLATVSVSSGTAKYSSAKFAVGTHEVKAVFKPSNTAKYKSSTSKIIKITVVK